MYTYVDVDVYVYVWPRVSYVRSYPGASRSRLLLPNNKKDTSDTKKDTSDPKSKGTSDSLPVKSVLPESHASRPRTHKHSTWPSHAKRWAYEPVSGATKRP